MTCPNCRGEFHEITLKGQGGAVRAKRCGQCNGFWFENNRFLSVKTESACQVDVPSHHFGLQEYTFMCPVDQTLMHEEADDHDVKVRYWHCTECQGNFLPRGQLATMCQARNRPAVSRSRAVEAILLSTLLVVVSVSAFRQDSLSLNAQATAPLPNAVPNLAAIILLVGTYLSGTVLAVLGRKPSVVLLGWLVIFVCLAGFGILIFGP